MTVRDFIEVCEERNFTIEVYIKRKGNKQDIYLGKINDKLMECTLYDEYDLDYFIDTSDPLDLCKKVYKTQTGRYYWFEDEQTEKFKYLYSVLNLTMIDIQNKDDRKYNLKNASVPKRHILYVKDE